MLRVCTLARSFIARPARPGPRRRGDSGSRPGRVHGSAACPAARRRRRPLRAPRDPQRDASSMAPARPPAGPVDIVIEGNRIAAVVKAEVHRGRHAPGEHGASRPRRRSTPPACTCCPVSSTCTCTRATFPRRPKRSTSTSSGWRTASPPAAAFRSPPRYSRRARRAAARATRSPRRACSPTGCPSTSGRAPSRPEGRAGLGADGGKDRHRRPQAHRVSARDHGGAAGRGEEARPGLDRAPQPVRRRQHERPRRRAARPRHGDALLRPVRSALRRPRASSPGPPATTTSTSSSASARWRGSGTWCTRRAARNGARCWRSSRSSTSILDPTMTAYLASRDVMRRRNADWHETVHAAVAVGLLPAEPRQPRLLLFRLDHLGRGRPGATSTASGWPS